MIVVTAAAAEADTTLGLMPLVLGMSELVILPFYSKIIPRESDESNSPGALPLQSTLLARLALKQFHRVGRAGVSIDNIFIHGGKSPSYQTINPIKNARYTVSHARLVSRTGRLHTMSDCAANDFGVECTRPLVARGFCDPHYRQDRAGTAIRKVRIVSPAGTKSVRDENGDKFCPRCNRWVSSEGFFACSTSSDLLQSMCKQCDKSTAAKRHAKDPSARQRNALLRRYEMTLESFQKKLEEQGHTCAICGTSEPGARAWQVDHNHSHHPEEPQRGCLECVRGILCWRCNITLGQVGEDISVLSFMIDYLREYNR